LCAALVEERVDGNIQRLFGGDAVPELYEMGRRTVLPHVIDEMLWNSRRMSVTSLRDDLARIRRAPRLTLIKPEERSEAFALIEADVLRATGKSVSLIKYIR
jgi:hypothetical protein